MAYSNLHEDFDPWEHVEDLDGEAHYHVLGISVKATSDQIKTAYRQQARVHHPDKGGSQEKFAAIQKAWEVLSDPQARQIYDDWAKQLKYRYIPGVTPKAEGGEDVLLDEFERLGLHCDAGSQLVVLCEVCGRPSTKTCCICQCAFCDFCTRKQHWKGRYGLHWPAVNRSMHHALARKELEAKRVEDAKRLMLEDPNYREESDLQDIRAFKRAAQEARDRPDAKVTYNLKLAKHYMWAQTARYVYLSCFVPTGYADKELVFEATSFEVTLQPEDSPPIIQRVWAHEVDTSRPIETYKNDDNRLFTMAVAKGKEGEHWHSIFKGDSAGARCLEPPYTLSESDDDVILEVKVPFWIDGGDVRVDINQDGLSLEVRGQIKLTRTFWKSPADRDKESYPGVVVPEESMWSLDDEVDEDGEDIKVLMITLPKPPLTEDEIMWKKGTRSDNRAQTRSDGPGRKGVRFFVDDEDYFHLEDILQALCFLEAGTAWVPAVPWENYHYPYSTSHRATVLSDLSKGAQRHLELMLKGEQIAEDPKHVARTDD